MRAAQLQRAVSHHKTQIARHRRELHAAKAALVAFEDECRRRGIKLVLVSPSTRSAGEGGIHGRPTHDPQS